MHRNAGRGRPGRGRVEDATSPAADAEVATAVRGWLSGRLPAEWFDGPPEVTVDREEITVVGRLGEPSVGDDASDAERAAAAAGRIRGFREDTRDARIAAALELEHRYGRKVAWGARCGERSELFTTLSVPVMTRLRQGERQVLDTLVAGGVARSRSDALAWCVRIVERNADAWLAELRDALQAVGQVRSQGPDAAGAATAGDDASQDDASQDVGSQDDGSADGPATS